MNCLEHFICISLVSPRIGLSNSLSLLLLLIIFIKATPYWSIPLEPVRPRLERPRSSFSTTGILLHGAARCTMYKWVKTQYEFVSQGVFVIFQKSPDIYASCLFSYTLVTTLRSLINEYTRLKNSSQPGIFHDIKRGREEKAYVVTMPPYLFIKVYWFIRHLRVMTLLMQIWFMRIFPRFKKKRPRK